MSLGRRLFELARTELSDVFRRIREPVRHPGTDASSWPPPSWTSSDEPSAPEIPEHVVRWYGNLELPVGAPEADIKRAYRRLVRRYHPDRHARDPDRAAVANQLSHELREAYEGLMTYLGSE